VKRIGGFLLLFILFSCLCGCAKKQEENLEIIEDFYVGYTLDDGRYLTLSLDVPYQGTTLGEAIFNNQLTVDNFVSTLEYIESLKDGGSKIYKYNQSNISNRTYGKEDFFVITCDGKDGIRDIVIAKHKETLMNKCSKNYDDLENVSMKIKEGSLTKKGATIIITDKSNRKNIYGNAYKLEERVEGKWQDLKTIIDDFSWTLEGYSVDETNTLEFKVNWENLYGTLKEGEYRIVKDASYAGEGTTHYITAPFSIE